MKNLSPKTAFDLSIPFRPLEYRNQRVITLELIDRLHERPPGTASRNFHENRDRFTEGDDFFRLSRDEIRLLGMSPGPKGLITLTESGYLVLVKSFTDDRAWRVQKALINVYFRSKETTGDLKGCLQELKQIIQRNDKTLSTVIELTTEGLSKITDVNDKVVDIRSRLPRREFSSKTKQLFREISLIKFAGRCQIFPKIVIVDDTGDMTPEGEYDHFIHHSENGPDHGWIISKKANREMKGSRQKYEPEFKIFQRELDAYLTENRIRMQYMPPPGAKKPVRGGQIGLFNT